MDPATFVRDRRGAVLTDAGLDESGTLLDGRSAASRTSLVDAYHAAHDPDIPTTVSWSPTFHERIDPTQAVPALVRAGAGAGGLS
ncbi:hypothetical protein JOD57_003746 [Geodermatophilus bullaregiensis]|uniref:hypothetical protein n=1 Tax=Geodermatophilus bullaregiensis TaxID=1564160 RepID=UPI00195D468E|nr:hypothetical protein [Geodermatophilus bullaregiensis]MBM7807909.1 hypothetical protein [Geodermatophilus bullaregiensis]